MELVIHLDVDEMEELREFAERQESTVTAVVRLALSDLYEASRGAELAKHLERFDSPWRDRRITR